MIRQHDLNCFDYEPEKRLVTMVFKECLIKLTINNKQLHFETDLLVDTVGEVPFFQKIMLIW